MADDFSLQEKAELLRDSIVDMLETPGTTLKPKQRDAFAAMLDHTPAEIAHSYFKLPTGFGKTVMFVLLARAYIDSLTTREKQNNRVVILVPRLVLTDQTTEKLSKFAELTGATFSSVIKGAERRTALNSDIIVSTYQSMDKLFDSIGPDNIGLIIADEAHHALGTKKMDMLTDVGKNVPIIGFTATPTYSDDRSVRDLLGTELFAMTIRDGVESGMLSPVKNILYRTSVVFDVANAPSSSSGEFDYKKLSGAMKLDVLIDEIAKIYVNGGDGGVRFRDLRAIINCPNIRVATAQAERINQLTGRTVAHAIHNEVKNFDKLKSDFMTGKFNVVCQVNTLTEGFDDPTVSLCINYPSRSRVKIEQSGGRAIRIDEDNPDKVAYVLDTIFRSRTDESLDETLQTAANGRQVLFRNVADGIVLFPADFKRDAERNGSARGPRDNGDYTGGVFDVITDNNKLLELEHKYNQHVANNYIGKKTKEWKSLTELPEYIVGAIPKIHIAMDAVAAAKEQGKYTNVLLEPRQGPIHTVLCLHIDTIDAFIIAANELGNDLVRQNNAIGPKTEEWKNLQELSEYIVSDRKIRAAAKAVENAKQQGKYANVRLELRRNGTTPVSCLHINDIDLFIEAAHELGYNLIKQDDVIGKKTEEWKSSKDLPKYIMGTVTKIHSAMKAVKDSGKYPNIRLEIRNASGNRTLCLHRDDMNLFVLAANELGYILTRQNNTIGPKTPEWKNAKELYNEYIATGVKTIRNAMNAINESGKYPNLRLEQKRTGKHTPWCVHIDDINTFIMAAKEFGYTLTLRNNTIGPKTEEWKNAKELYNEYITTDIETIRNAMNAIKESGKYPELRLETKNANGKHMLCLHRDDVAVFIFAANALGHTLTLRDNTVGPKTEEWKNAKELYDEYMTTDPKIIRGAMNAIKESDKHPELRLETKNANGKHVLCLYRDDVAAFIFVANTLGYNLKQRDNTVGPKTEKWKSATDLNQSLFGSFTTINNVLDAVNKSGRYPNIRIEERRSGNGTPLCLYFDDLDAFIDAANALGYKLERRTTPKEKLTRGKNVLGAATAVVDASPKPGPDVPQH